MANTRHQDSAVPLCARFVFLPSRRAKREGNPSGLRAQRTLTNFNEGPMNACVERVFASLIFPRPNPPLRQARAALPRTSPSGASPAAGKPTLRGGRSRRSMSSTSTSCRTCEGADGRRQTPPAGRRRGSQIERRGAEVKPSRTARAPRRRAKRPSTEPEARPRAELLGTLGIDGLECPKWAGRMRVLALVREAHD